jgi:heme-degrading monooxygenase HmoA
MGSGKNGTFSTKPDWQQWGIFTVSNRRLKNVQIKHMAPEILLKKLYGPFINWWLLFFKCQTITYMLQPMEGHGLWDGKQPFGELPHKTDFNGTVAVLTRATIRFNRLKQFWANVNSVAVKMAGAGGFITSYGIGEVPFVKQATFSIWESKDDMKKFAYQMPEHQEVIKKTRQEKWYSEDMFVRFKIEGCVGSLNGNNPLKGKL